MATTPGAHPIIRHKRPALDGYEIASYPFFLFVGGLSDYRPGRYDRAVAAMRGEASGVLGPAPGLVLAMALSRMGRADEARRALAAALLAHDWKKPAGKDPDIWIYHVLRREAEKAVPPPGE